MPKLYCFNFLWYLGILGTIGTYVELTLDDVMTLGWDINESLSEITLTMKCRISKGYCAFGLGSEMKNSDIYAITASDSSISVGDYWSSGHSGVHLDTTTGGQNNIEFQISTSDSSQIKAQFKRKLTTGDQKDTKIVPNQVSPIIWAYVDGSSGMTYHHNNNCNFHSDKGKIIWSTSGSSTLYTKSSDEDIKRHGIAMTIAWGVLAPIGILVTRYFRTRSWANKVHIIFLLACSLISIISSSDQFNDNEHSYEFYDDETLLHSRIGLTLTSLVIAQTCFGLFTLIAKICTKNTRLTRLFIRAHKLVGYSMLIAGLINLYSGWDNYGENKELMVIIYTVVPVAFASFEIYQRFFKNKFSNFHKKLDVLEYFEVVEEVRKGKKLVFADDLVIDVSKFYAVHAGGSFMLTETLLEDVGKYMAGCKSIGEEFNTYTHSQNAYCMLADLAIGRVLPPSGYLDVPSNFTYDFMEFTLENKLEVNKHVCILVLTSSEFTANNNEHREISWLGKHFIVIYEEEKRTVKRYFPSLLADSKKLISSQEENSNLDSQKENDKAVRIVIDLSEKEFSNQYFIKIETGQMLKIKGPLGPGLLIKSLEGRFLSIVHDTGLIPFLDLIETAHKEIGNSSTQFKLNLYVFFSTGAHEFSLKFLKTMSENCNWLDYHIEIGDYKNSDMKTKIRNAIETEINLAWISGSSGFNRHYNEILLNSGLPKSKIILI